MVSEGRANDSKKGELNPWNLISSLPIGLEVNGNKIQLAKPHQINHQVNSIIPLGNTNKISTTDSVSLEKSVDLLSPQKMFLKCAQSLIVEP